MVRSVHIHYCHLATGGVSVPGAISSSDCEFAGNFGFAFVERHEIKTLRLRYHLNPEVCLFL